MYTITLTNGHIHRGSDERDPDDLLESVTEDYDDLPPGWVWLAGLYVRRSEIVSIALSA